MGARIDLVQYEHPRPSASLRNALIWRWSRVPGRVRLRGRVEPSQGSDLNMPTVSRVESFTWPENLPAALCQLAGGLVFWRALGCCARQSTRPGQLHYRA